MAEAAIHTRTYVISDLHLGGEHAKVGASSARGFGIFSHTRELTMFISGLVDSPVGPIRTELVINGDIVDFLAERESGDQPWSAVKSPAAALSAFDAIVDREAAVFAALAALLQSGHRLTLLLGNHDIELSYPNVRKRLEAVLGYDGRQDLHFVYDGEAYTIGDVLIEHGNRYDPFNVTDNDSLRRIRSLLSRKQDVPEIYAFAVSAGSRIVAEVLNPIKVDHPFIDLLKPENETVLPMLLALEPKYRSLLGKFALLAARSCGHRTASPAMPSSPGDIDATVDGLEGAGPKEIAATLDFPTPAEGLPREAALAAVASSEPEYAVEPLLLSVLKQDYADFEAALSEESADAAAAPGDISGFLDRVQQYGASLYLLVKHRAKTKLDRRLPALRLALKAVIENQSFDPTVETGTDYLNAANELAGRGFKLILFGHTHLPKRIHLKTPGAQYFNTGTWADMIKFDKRLLETTDVTQVGVASPSLKAFVEAIEKKDFGPWIDFSPHYARLDFTRDADGNDVLVHAGLLPFKAPVPEA